MIEPFTIEVSDEVLDDLRRRLRMTRWPEPSPAEPWSQGTDLGYLQDICRYWADEFDWRAEEQRLNSFHHFTTQIEGARIHFVHERARAGGGIPILLSHGWPSSFAELLPLVPLLTNPQAHGIGGPAFDVVLPALPGYPFSERPHRTGVTYHAVAGMWHELMQRLGYQKYAVGGGDFGAGVVTFMALDLPESVVGVHLTNLELAPYLGADARPLSVAEQRFRADADVWARTERGYNAIQSTKPQTLSYALNDSPAGLAAWILEKWRSWTDSAGDLDQRFSRDFLLTQVTLYWVAQSITTSMRDYFDNARWQREPGLTASDLVRVPTAVAVFPHMFVPEGEPPREWAERLYSVRRWTVMPRGAHFAPAEEPDLVARDICAFFGGITNQAG